MEEKRDRVYEWRITRKILGTPFTARFWIETDPNHGGVFNVSDAQKDVNAAERLLKKNEMGVQLTIARRLLELVPVANSVEVCDEAGNGVAAHRDWP